MQLCVDGAPLCSPLREPEEELCDGEDNDCDGAIDEGCDLSTCTNAQITVKRARWRQAKNKVNVVVVAGETGDAPAPFFTMDDDPKTYAMNLKTSKKWKKNVSNVTEPPSVIRIESSYFGCSIEVPVTIE